VHNLRLKQRGSPDLMQVSGTSRMHFTIAEVNASLAGKVALWPGDATATSSPPDNVNPNRMFHEAGKKLTVEIQRTERLLDPIVAGE
jgi:2-keto-4-pentenoate hydratase/2-oxohepta-3-ene-1,7-dioic acid hydratase in catechol pathway